MYRHVLFVSTAVVAVLSTTLAVGAADTERCRELGNRFRVEKGQMSAIEVSLALFSAADGSYRGKLVTAGIEKAAYRGGA